MIEWLANTLVPFSLLMALLLIIRPMILSKFGASFAYLIWGVVPLSLVIDIADIKLFNQSVIIPQEVLRYITIAADSQPSTQNVDWMFISWSLGCSLMAAFCLVSLVRMHRSISGFEANKAPLLYQLPKNLAVRISNDDVTPFLVGVVSPKLILPKNFSKMFSKTQQQLIIEHELCHYQRGDLVWNAVAFLVLTLFWFNPLVWLAYFRFRQDQELSCDHQVLKNKHKENRVEYSKAIVCAATYPSFNRFTALPFIHYGEKKQMLERINCIGQLQPSSLIKKMVMLLFSSFIITTYSWAGHSVESEESAKASQEKVKAIQPQAVMRIAPKYPLQAAKQRIEGSVLLKYDITPAGQVINVSVIKATPEQIFNNSASTALSQWEYASSSNGFTNNIVQLDFAMDEDSSFDFVDMTERIQVNQ